MCICIYSCLAPIILNETWTNTFRFTHLLSWDFSLSSFVFFILKAYARATTKWKKKLPKNKELKKKSCALYSAYFVLNLYF